MFRIDNDHVIDATLTGGPARWVALGTALSPSSALPIPFLGLRAEDVHFCFLGDFWNRVLWAGTLQPVALKWSHLSH